MCLTTPLALEAEPADTVDLIKEKVPDKEDIPPDIALRTFVIYYRKRRIKGTLTSLGNHYSAIQSKRLLDYLCRQKASLSSVSGHFEKGSLALHLWISNRC